MKEDAYDAEWRVLRLRVCKIHSTTTIASSPSGVSGIMRRDSYGNVCYTILELND